MYKIVLIGAGSAKFGLGTIGDIFKSNLLNGCEIVLHDINEVSLSKTKQIADEFRDKLKINSTVTATLDRKYALKDASFCIISIEVGNRFDLWDQDWKIPLQYGFRQVYGENGGPGGLFHSLRIIPPILEICEDIAKLCPDAFVFNFSNPMQRICHAVTTKYPNLKFVGLCHEIASMERQLPNLMETSFSNIEVEAGGLNHLSILLSASYKDSGESGYPIIRKKFGSFYSSLINDHEGGSSKAGAERGVFFKIFEDYGYLPITTDSHLGEYINWAYSVADHEAIMDFYDNYKKHCLAFFDDTTNYEMFFDKTVAETHERVIPIIEAIIEDSNMRELAVNVPNKGFLIRSLPEDIVVEVPATVNKTGVNGQNLVNYPKNFGALLNSQSGAIQLTTEAVLNQSKHIAKLALLADPVVTEVDGANKLLENMVAVQSKFLGYLE